VSVPCASRFSTIEHNESERNGIELSGDDEVHREWLCDEQAYNDERNAVLNKSSLLPLTRFEAQRWSALILASSGAIGLFTSTRNVELRTFRHWVELMRPARKLGWSAAIPH